MGKILKTILSAIILVSTVEAGGFALSGVGARALSMGGAFRAIANDWSAVYWNPAGLYDQEQFLSINLLGIKPQSYFEPNTGILGYDGPYSLREKVNSAPQDFAIPSFAFLTPMEIGNSKIAVSFTVPFGLGSKWDLYDFPIGYYNTQDTTFKIPEYEKHDWQSNLSVYNLHLSYATDIKGVKVGLSVGASRASIMLRKVQFFDPAEMDTSARSLPIQYRLFPIDTKIEGTGWGLSGILGLMFDITPQLTFGASVRAYSNIKLDGNATLIMYFPRNDYLMNQLPPSEQFMFSGTTAEGTGTFNTTLPLPVNAGAGISYKPTEKLRIALDVDWTRWFTLDKIAVNFNKLVLKVNGTIPLDTVKSDTLNLLWKNTYRVSGGIEYDINPVWTVRAGAYWDQSPVPDNTITVLIPDPGNKISLNAGFGYKIKNVELNFNYEHILKVERTVPRTSDYSYKSDYLAGKYGMFINGIGLNITYKF